MRYNDLFENNKHDDDLFGQSNKTIKKIQIANFQAHLPEFQLALKSYTVAAAGPTAREITKELGQVYRYFRGSEEVEDLAHDMITQELPGYLTSVVQWVAQDPSRADNEDEMYDYLSNLCEDIRHKSELWIYITEILEELADGPGEGMDEYEFDLAMVISGELTQMITNGIQQSFAKVEKLQSLQPVTEAATDQYQRMMNFVKANSTPGVPEEQQIAMALFRQLEKQQVTNRELSAELDAAEKRIDVAAKSGEMARQELNKHQVELDRERDAMGQQQDTMDKTTQAFASREEASKQQIQILANKLEQIKAMPGISNTEAKRLETQIQQISKNGLSAEKVKELESSIVAVQRMGQVDDKAMKELIAKVNDAQARTQELEKTKQSLSKNVDQSNQDLEDEVEQLRQQLARVNGLGQTVDSIRRELDALGTSYEETDATVFDLEAEVDNINKSLSARTKAAATADQIRQTPQQAAQAQAAQAQAAQAVAQARTTSKVDPRLVQSLMKQGIFQPDPVAENKFFAAVKWATKK